MLIKLLATIGLITIFIYGTSYLASEINKSEECLLIEVNKFNEKPAANALDTFFPFFNRNKIKSFRQS